MDTRSPQLGNDGHSIHVCDAKDNDDDQRSHSPFSPKRLSRFKLIKHVPRAVFKNKPSKLSSRPDNPVFGVDHGRLSLLLPLYSPLHSNCSHSDLLPVRKFTIQSPRESMNDSSDTQLVLVQSREQGSTTDSQDIPSVSSHASLEQSAINTSSNTSSEFTRDALEEVVVPELLLHGVPLLKVSAKKVQTRVFRLDPDRGQISWESKKTKFLSVEAIKEIRTGQDARSYRIQLKIADAEPRWITIVYLADMKYKTLNIIAPSVDVYHMWVDTVSKLWNLRRELASMSEGRTNGDSARDVLRKEKVWERLYWKTANEAGGERLEWDEVKKLCLRLNVHAPEEDLIRKFKEADVDNQGFLNFADFQRFVKLLKARPEIQRLYNMVRAGGELDFHKFKLFMRNYQKCTLPSLELERIFNNFAPIPQSPMLSPREMPSDPVIIESSDNVLSPTTTTPGTSTPTLSLSAFTSFLQSADNAPFSDIPHDMTKPLSEYYISSSHNTYLVGHQLVGNSTTEGYIRALLQGCRSVELDIYDGEVEPMIFHGKTLTGKVSLREVCVVIAKYAFLVSPYPIIISAEVHCGLVQQDMIAEIMKETFGDTLVTKRLEERSDTEALPSPEELKGRVLLKAKNLNLLVDATGDFKETRNVYEAASESSTDEWDAAKAERMLKSEAKELKNEIEQSLSRARNVLQRVRGASVSPQLKSIPLPQESPKSKVKMSLALTELLVYTIGVKCRGLNKKEQYAIEHVFSISEKTANKMLKQTMADLIKHTRTHVIRVYPNGLRLNSSNYEPHRYWVAGAQLVALNWQTFDLGWMINYAMFQRNGRSGYVLKPPPLRTTDKAYLMQRYEYFLDVIIISAQQLPRARDKEGREILNKHIIDPYVEVSLFIPDWTHSPFQDTSQHHHHMHLPHLSHHARPRDFTQAGPAASSADDVSELSSLAPPTTVTSSTAARTVTARTGVVKNNGFNPVWEESLSLPFDCVGEMYDLIFVKFTVKQENSGDNENTPVYCSSMGSLREGFRHLPLHDQQFSQYLFSTLFVRIQIRDANPRLMSAQTF